MEWKTLNIITDLIGIVGKFSPLIATALGSPVAGLVVSGLCHLFGVAEPEALQAAISSDPNAEGKFKAFEAQYAEELAVAKVQAASQDYKTQTDSMEGAREREIDELKITGKRDFMIPILALLVVSGFFAICLINYFIKLSDDHVMIMLIGQLSGGFGMVLSYYFGATKS